MTEQATTAALFSIEVFSIRDRLPHDSYQVFVWHDQGVDRGCLYGEVWRLADYGEDQMHGVTHWAYIPRELMLVPPVIEGA